MFVARNYFTFFVSVLLLSSCTSAEFPQLRADSEKEKIYVEDDAKEVTVDDEGTVIIAAVAPEHEVEAKEVASSIAKMEDEGVVIVASAAKPGDELKSEAKMSKVKPILKSKKRTDLSKAKNPDFAEAKFEKSLSANKILVDKKVTKSVVEVVENDATHAVEEVEVVESFVENTDQNKEPSVTYQIETFYFDNGSSVVRNEDRTKVINIVKLAKEKNATIYVLGYSSSRTNDADYISHKMANFKTSLARAESVADALIRAGLSDKKVLLEALSDSRPAYLEVMPEGERLNRRVEVYIGY